MERKIPGKRCVSRTYRQSRRRPGCIRLYVCPTTGGRLEISVSPQESILGLKAALARKLRTNPARITLIYREKVLTSGRIIDHSIPEDSQLTLLPNMESGLSLHQSDKSITQALENLTESQVNDFLSGRSPLMLAIRMGEHMVFVQLQLSTLQGQGQAGASQPRPQVTPMNPTTATLLSQSGLSASALAQATRCLSQRIHRLHGISRSSNGIPSSRPRTSNQTPVSSVPTMSRSTPTPATATPLTTAPVSTPSSLPMTSLTPAGSRPSGSTLASLQQLPTRTTLASTSGTLPSPPPSPGAVIDSMKHVGSGIYSGTFSGTLDPSLQDNKGQPRRSVNTILHILNDLLVAAPNSPVIGQNQNQQGGAKSQPTTLPTPTQPALVPDASLTPPPSPKSTENNACPIPDNSENVLLRDKMQRVQMMLAQRKERRHKRRQLNAPYSPQMNSETSSSSPTSDGSEDSQINTSNIATSSSSSTSPTSSSPSSSSTSSDRSRICSHVEGNSECCGSYCKASLEQDSLVV